MILDSQDELGGLVGLLLVALQKCSADSKRLAAQNVVFAGGGAQIPGVCCVQLLVKGGFSSSRVTV